MTTKFPVEKFAGIETPFYYYDVELLRRTLDKALEEAGKYDGFHVHYAIKANFNPQLLEIIKSSGMGADCVSGGEVRAAIADLAALKYEVLKKVGDAVGNTQAYQL